ncbi:hypothetical protein V8E55_001346 [Tylopilus felleus]
MRADGRFGYVDPYQWPQYHSADYPWSVAILSKTYHASPSQISWAWYTPRYDHFVLQKDSAKGNLNRDTIDGLKGLLSLIVPRMRNTSNASEIDQFVPQPPSRWLGGFTSSPLHAEGLCAAGVPVWLVRDEGDIGPQVIIEDIVTMWEPSDIVIHHYMDPVGQFAWPFDVELEGYSGHKDMHAKFREVTYRHKSLAPTTSQNSGGAHRTHRGGKAREGWQPYDKDVPRAPPMQRDLWDVVENTYLPSPLDVMEGAFVRIKSKLGDKEYKSVINPPTPLRFPDPVMMAVVQSPDTMRRYFANWLAIRTTWTQLLIANLSATETLTSKEWRAFLNSTPADLESTKATTSAQGRLNVLKRLHNVLPDNATGMTWAGDDKVTFRNHVVKVFKSIPPPQARAITWELCELHFQYDLLAMDREMVPKKWEELPAEREALWREVCPEHTLGGSWDGPLPTAENGLMRTVNERDKFQMLNAFARLLSGWPGAPKHFAHHPITPTFDVTTLYGARSELMTFYTKKFYQHNGRPPIFPRHLPDV